MQTAKKQKAVGYDKYVDWKLFIFPVIIVILILVLPTPYGMKDVGTEYGVGKKAVIEYVTKKLFEQKPSDVLQWQILTSQIMEQNVIMGVFSKKKFLERDTKWCKKYKIPADFKNLAASIKYIDENFSDEAFESIMKSALDLRRDKLKYEDLKDNDKKAADHSAWAIKVTVATMVFVVFCFMTECIPLPSVAFCVGLLYVATGVYTRDEAPMMYWSDSVWFIMGSLMFAVAFVKTGVDKRVALLLFKKLAVPSVGAITLVLYVILAPLSAFISDHALAAMFLPIAILLYQNSLTKEIPEDKELIKMLLITVCMAPNIGGFGSPSGGARNVIMMTYLNDMFGIDIGYFQWVIYGMPYVIVMIPITWFLTTWRFKPTITSLAPAMKHLETQISKMGGWSKQQIIAVIIFLVMLFLWFTEKTFYDMGIFPFRLGLGVVALGGAVAYIMAGTVNWRDYHEKVDWGVVWLYAGAIAFGRALDGTGAAYWLARTCLDLLAPLGMDSGLPLLMVNGAITAALTNLMADGPAAAAIGPITLNIANLAHPGTTFVPFMALVTSSCASMAYCLIIGTPPNAIVYSSGYLDAKDFLRIGLPLWFIAQIVMAFFVVFYWNFLGFGNLPSF